MILHCKKDWEMGYKNSIDSATLVNKCLELVEAHYLFNIPFDKLDILIHPEALVHSVIEYENYVTHFNLFKNDMKIPILNFLQSNRSKYVKNSENLYIKNLTSLNFQDVKNDIFPIYKFFKILIRKTPKFN